MPAPALRALVVSAALTLPAAADTPLNVLATVGMVADVAQAVAGDCADVTTLIGPGSDPHLYRPSAGDVRRLAGAELILFVHPALEARLAEVLSGLSGRVPAVGLLEAAYGPDDLRSDPEAPGQVDPHLWMDASRWARIAPVIASAIAEARPACADALLDRASVYAEQLATLHDWVGAAIATIPQGSRLLVTAHDAFGYFADAYGIEASEAIEGISTTSEASIADIRSVAAFVAERGVPAVFPETTISPRTMAALVAELRAMGHEVVIGPALHADAMGAADTPEGTYIGMIRANTLAITGALGGTAPDWPPALADWAAAWGLDP